MQTKFVVLIAMHVAELKHGFGEQGLINVVQFFPVN
jgi:hypothetical protein